MRNVLALRRVVALSFMFCGVLACGSRTGLFGGDGEEAVGINVDGSTPHETGVGIFIDGGFVTDAPNSLDARPPVDVYRNDCPDSDALLVYTITDQYELQSFNPGSGQFTTVGHISCPAPDGFTPFSMAVDRRGVAYILFTDDHIYQASTATGACIGTSYVPGQSGFQRFGMGFATNSIGPTETLFVAGDSDDGNGGKTGTAGLARVATDTFNLSFVGDDPIYTSAELTGTGDGRLFAFYRHTNLDTGSNIGELDTQTGNILGERHFPTVEQGQGWAFAFWGGDFYMFHAPDPNGRQTIVTRWRPSDDSVTDIAQTTSGTVIVGAGVSTCAPQQ